MKKKKNKKADYSILFNLIFVIIFISIALGLYYIYGHKNVTQMVESTEKVYKEKVESSTIPKRLPEQKAPEFEKFSYKYSYTINVSGRIAKLIFKLPVPYDENEKQYIINNSFSLKPMKIYNENENTIAEFQLEHLNNQSVQIDITGIANVRTYDYKTAAVLNKNISNEKNLNQYIAPSLLIESNDSVIKNAANKIKGGTREEIVNNIYNFVVSNLKYNGSIGTIGAKKALQQKQGKCSEFSALMVALCRAKNIPARVVVGQIAREQNTKHNWVEVYFDKYGWVAYEPTERPTVVRTYNAQGKLVKQETRINGEESHVKYIASGRNKFTPWEISYSVTEQSNGNVTVDERFEIRKQ